MKANILLPTLFLLLLQVPAGGIGAGSPTFFTVVLDAGHGGRDPGTTGSRVKEKDVVLALALKIGRLIRQSIPGAQVIYTRDRDVFVPLHERADIANKCRADLFISLHANHYSQSFVSGAETYVLGLHRSQENLEVAKKENSVILLEEDYSTTYEGFDPNLPESYIMFEMVQDEYLDQSIRLGSLVQEQLKGSAGRKDRGVRQAGFLVLRQISMPGILVEVGYLSNPAEARYLSSGKGLDNLASSVFQAVKAYKASVDSRRPAKTSEPVGVRKDTAEQAENLPSPPVVPGPKEATPASRPQTTPISGDIRPSGDPEIYFSIQLMALKEKIETSPDAFKQLEGVFAVEQDGMYKYMYAKEVSFKSIVRIRTELQKKFPEAFIVATRNNRRISVQEARKILGE